MMERDLEIQEKNRNRAIYKTKINSFSTSNLPSLNLGSSIDNYNKFQIKQLSNYNSNKSIDKKLQFLTTNS